MLQPSKIETHPVYKIIWAILMIICFVPFAFHFWRKDEKYSLLGVYSDHVYWGGLGIFMLVLGLITTPGDGFQIIGGIMYLIALISFIKHSLF